MCKLNTLSANSGRETAESSLGPAASNSPIEAKASAPPETETRINEVKQQIPSLNPHSGNEVMPGRCSPPEEEKQRDFLMDHHSVSRGLDTATNAKFNKNLQFVPSEARGTNKTASQALSPSAFMKRRRKRKRRISTEPHESVHGYERQVLLKQSDSEDDYYPPRGGVHLSQPEGLVGLLTTHPSSTNPSVEKGEDLSQSFAPNNESRVRKEQFTVRPSQQPLVQEVDELSPVLPCSAENSIADESGIATKTGNGLQFVHSDVTDRRVTGSENGRSTKCCTAEVKSITPSILPSASDPVVEDGQHDRLSSGQSVLAVEARHSGGDFDTLCQRRNELEMNHQDKDKYSPTAKEVTTVKISSEVPVPNRTPEEFKTRHHPGCNKVPRQAAHASTSDTHNSCLPKSPSNVEINTGKQQEEHPLEAQTSSKAAVLLEKCKLKMPQVQDDENHLRGISKIKTSPTFSEGLIKNPSDMSTLLSQRCASCETGLTVSHSSGNITDRSCSSVSQAERQGGEGDLSQIQANPQDRDPTNQTVWHETPESKCDSEDSIEKHPVYTMSSFWRDMEKLTIKDILDLRKVGTATPSSFLPPLQESDAAETDSGFLTQPEFEQNSEDVFIVQAVIDSNSGSRLLADRSSSGSVRWESEPVPLSAGAALYPDDMTLTTFSDISLSALAEKCPRKFSKNVSVHNLHALDSEHLSAPAERHNLQKVEDKELDTCTLTEGHVHTAASGSDCLPSSLADSFRVSLTDIFNSIFGKKQSIPSQSATGNISSSYTVGESVSENYDHFFSDFDTETFFCPLLNRADQDKDRLMPIFSRSRSSRGNLQYPEAYDYFFATSSSDDSSVETDEEDNKDQGPVKVVTRFSCKTNATALSADAYENFFTDSDLKQDFFWKGTFSFRNFNFMGSTSQKLPSQPLALQPVRQKGKSPLSVVYSINVPGTDEVLLPDPVLHHVENRIITQLAQQPFSYKDLQTPAPNPRLDSSLLPLRQSDMCLVCIAFASWVLKSANPDIGDAWKAVLLANASALSAIRYLRKYVTAEATDNEKKVHHEASV
ncbi:PGC-1 and ERR-induced regulator in muscle protein 1 [Thalassophryne amazonica]|uniref:PGC-1 and ERR-induced regulator in muscle protein 1 n=1 Tax=Thalassophryne amazonica TaxID=390379 RepID=UPI00147177D8|nr:PGC-1 and ERR-induced regulator in muscle protein 1 [Thalassophryne amazonica]